MTCFAIICGGQSISCCGISLYAVVIVCFISCCHCIICSGRYRIVTVCRGPICHNSFIATNRITTSFSTVYPHKSARAFKDNSTYR